MIDRYRCILGLSRLALGVLIAGSWAPAHGAEPPAGPRTMRVDYFHTGRAGSDEIFALRRVAIEPLPWPGNPRHPLDDSNLGEYFFEITDRETHRPLYSRGYSTWFETWEKTGAAYSGYRTFEESIRFPAPDRPVVVRVRRRDRRGDFAELWSFVIDPADKSISRSAPPSLGAPIEIQKKGPSSTKVDLLLLGDGYTAKERDRFVADARRLTEALFAHEPFRSRRNDWNVWALVSKAQDSGVSRPSVGTEVRSPFATTYGALEVDSYLATFDEHGLRDAAANAPYDALVVLANSNVYGGSAIFNGPAVVASGSPWSPFLIAHEVGQSFAGLGVENYTWEYPSPAPGVNISTAEPWNKNITVENAAVIKWQDLLTPGVTTSWDRAGYYRFQNEILEAERALRAQGRPESDFDMMRQDEKVRSAAFLAAEAAKLDADKTHESIIGTFEGANHFSFVFRRPQLDCVMFSRDDVDFCAVCQRAIEQVIDLYSK